MELTNGDAFVLDGSWSTPQESPFSGMWRSNSSGTDELPTASAQQYTSICDTNHGNHNETLYWGADPRNELLTDFVESIRTTWTL